MNITIVSILNEDDKLILKERGEKLFQLASLIIGVPENSVRHLHIVDESHYAATINSVSDKPDGKEAYTKNEVFTGVAKTLEHREAESSTSSLIIQTPLIALIQTGSFTFEEISKRPVQEQLYFYILAHELGHCKDHYLRPQLPDPELTIDGLFKIHQVAAYYLSILRSEVAACFHSALAVTQTLFDHEIDEFESTFRNILFSIVKCRIKHGISPEQNSLWNLAFDVSGGFWTMLIQYAKLVGTSIGNPGLDFTRAKRFRKGETTNIILNSSEQLIRKEMVKYPQLPGDEDNTMWMELWNRLSNHWGFRFEAANGGDGVFFNNTRIVQYIQDEGFEQEITAILSN